MILVVNSSRKATIGDNCIDGRPNGDNPHFILVTVGGNTFRNPSNVLLKDDVLVNGGKRSS